MYLIGEYLYILSKNGLTLKHRTYAINQDDKDLLECKEDLVEELNLQKQEFGIWGGGT